MEEIEHRQKELLLEILKQMQGKYRYLVEIDRLTVEIRDALARNDMMSAQLLLKMRGEEMEQAGVCIRNMNLLMANTENTENNEIRQLVKGIPQEKITGFEAEKIVELANIMERLLNKIIEMDKLMNKRLAGDKSFYN